MSRSVSISVSIPLALAEKVDAAAKAADVSVSAFLRQVVAEKFGEGNPAKKTGSNFFQDISQ